jgi:hypothetical protein
MSSLFIKVRAMRAILIFFISLSVSYAQETSKSQEEVNCALVQRLFSEGYNQRYLNMLSDVIAVDYVEELNGIESKGIISVIKSIKWLEEIAPDFKLTEEDIICRDDKVIIRWKYRGMDVRYNKEVRLDGIYIAQIKDGKIMKGWQVFDNYQRFTQLGYDITAPADSVSGEK